MTAKRTGVATALALGLLLIVAAPALALPGDVLWNDQVHMGGVVGDDTGVVLKLDAAENPIIAAQSATGASSQEYLYWSYWPTGIWRGEGHWNGPGSSFETVNGMELDGSGASYTVGSTQSPTTGADMYLVCRSNAGVYVRERFYNGPANGNDEAMAVTVDPVGNAWYTGMSEDSDGDMDVVTVMIDSTGVETWAKRYNSPYNRFDGGFAIAKRGNALYVAGISNRIGHGDDLLLIRYNATTGARTWVRRYDDPLHRHEHVSDVVATSTSVYVCGSGKAGAVAPGDAMIARFSSSGVQKWVKYFGGALDENFSDMQRAPSGNIVVTGFDSRKATLEDWVTVWYRTDGTIRQARWFGSLSGKKLDTASALDIADGKIYVTGSLESSTHGSDVRTICYTSTGMTDWTSAAWNGADNGDDSPWDVEVSSDAVWITGTTYVAANGPDMLTIKYEK